MNMSVGGPVGGYVPMSEGRLKQSASTSGTRVRITPENFRQVLGPNSDVHLSPDKLKQLYDKGYLDVVKSRQTMESNEGMFTIGTKAAMGLMAIFGPAGFQPPSRSLGAISIDPMYLEMVKDPNHKTGFGYTRVENESIQVLPSPEFPPSAGDTTPDPEVAVPPMQFKAPKPEEAAEEKKKWDAIKTQGKENPPEELPKAGPGKTVYSLSMHSWWIGKGDGKAPDLKDHNSNVTDSTLSGSFQEMLHAGWGKPSMVKYMNAHQIAMFTGDMAQQNGFDQAKHILTSNPGARRARTEWTQPRIDESLKTNLSDPNKGQKTGANDYGFLVTQHKNIPLSGKMLERYNGIKAEFNKLPPDQQPAGMKAFLDKPNPSMYDLYVAKNMTMKLGDKIDPPSADAAANQTALKQTYQNLFKEVAGKMGVDTSKLPANFADNASMEDLYALQIVADGLGGPNGKPAPLISKGEAQAILKMDPATGQVSLKNDDAAQNALLKVTGKPQNAAKMNSSEIVASYRLCLEANYAQEAGRTFQFSQDDTDEIYSMLEPELVKEVGADRAKDMKVTRDDAALLDQSMNIFQHDNKLEGASYTQTQVLRGGHRGEMRESFLTENNAVKEPVSLPDPKTLQGAEKDVVQGLGALKGMVSQRHIETGYSSASVDRKVKDLAAKIDKMPDGELKNKCMQELTRLRDIDNAKRGQFVQTVGGGGDAPDAGAIKGVVQRNIAKLQPGVTNADALKTKINEQIDAYANSSPKPSDSDVAALKKELADGMTRAAQSAPPALDKASIGKDIQNLKDLGPGVENWQEAETSIGKRIDDAVASGSMTADEAKGLKEQLTTAVTSAKQPGAKIPPQGMIEHEGKYYDPKKVEAVVRENLDKLQAIHDQVNPGEGKTAQKVDEASTVALLNEIERELQLLAAAPGAKVKDSPAHKLVADLTKKRDDIMKSETMQKIQQSGGNAGQLAGKEQGVTFQDNVTKSLDSFRQKVKGVIADGGVTYDEQAKLQSFVDDTSRNMIRTLRDSGVEGFAGLSDNDINGMKSGEMGQRLTGVDAKKLESANVKGELADKMLLNVDKLKSAQAALNVSNDGSLTKNLYTNVRALNNKLDEFEAEGVVKAAFRGEMKEFATKNEGAFVGMMQGIYGLPAPVMKTLDAKDPQGNPMRVLDRDNPANAGYIALLDKAKNGTLPFPPNVKFVESSEIGGANGAYSRSITINGKKEPAILLSRDLLQQPEKLREVFAEEMFHHLEHEDEIQRMEVQSAQGKVKDYNEKAPELKTEIQGLKDKLADLETRFKALKTEMEASDEFGHATDKNFEPSVDYAEKQIAYGDLNKAIEDTKKQLGTKERALGKLETDKAQGLRDLDTAGELDKTGKPKRDLDAAGDEGRAGIMALREMRKANYAGVQNAIEQGRGQVANVGGNVKKGDAFDQGKVQEGGIRIDGGRLGQDPNDKTPFNGNPLSTIIEIEGGSDMEFNSDPVIRDDKTGKAKASVGGDGYFEQTPGLGQLNPQASQVKKMGEVPTQGAEDMSRLDHSKNPNRVYQSTLGQGKVEGSTDVTYSGDAEKSAVTKTKIAEMMMDAFPRGAQSVGQMLTKFFDEMRDKIIKAYASILGKEVFMAHGAIYGEGGSHLHDADAVAGRPDDYKAKQTNHMFRDSVNQKGMPNYEQHGGAGKDSALTRRDQEYRQKQSFLTPEELDRQKKTTERSAKIQPSGK